MTTARHEKSSTAGDRFASLRLRGTSGLFKDEEFEVRVGQCVTVGRSRLCEVSAARTKECARIGRDVLEANKSYRKISRRHFRIAFLNPDMVEVEDLSTNGTLVNGSRVDRLVINDMRKRTDGIVVGFGEAEEMKVTLERGGTPRPRTGEDLTGPEPDYPRTEVDVPRTIQE